MIDLLEKIKIIQSSVGASPVDGIFGNVTANAVINKLNIPTEIPSALKKIKVCIDAGHGFSNKAPGIYDTGAVSGDLKEADITLSWALALEKKMLVAGIPVYMSRGTSETPRPVNKRAEKARMAGCNVLLSIHVNDSDNEATGIETLYLHDRGFAEKINNSLIESTGLRNRGLKFRNDLVVLKFSGTACLVELGFISNKEDMKKILSPETISLSCDSIVSVIKTFKF